VACCASKAKLKEETLEVTYSYWDGSGHRRTIEVTKGTSISKFLEAVRVSIASDFHELRAMGSDGLLYIKEDLIIPGHYSFYDLIVTKVQQRAVQREGVWACAPLIKQS